jgi:hypothetical protein
VVQQSESASAAAVSALEAAVSALEVVVERPSPQSTWGHDRAGQQGQEGAASMAAPSSKKRSHGEANIHLDPVFEMAFKRRCQLPPTPPRRLNVNCMSGK